MLAFACYAVYVTISALALALLWFHAPWYRERYPDVAAAGIEPLMHYIRHGRAEGRIAFRSPLAGHRTTSRAVEALVARFASDEGDAGVGLHVPDEILLRVNETFLRRGTRVSD